LPDADGDVTRDAEPEAAETSEAPGPRPVRFRLPRLQTQVFRPRRARWRLVAVALLVALATAALVVVLIGISS